MHVVRRAHLSLPPLRAGVCCAAVWSGLVGVGCSSGIPTVPLDAPVFPKGLALAGDQLLVVSSDYDLAYADGAVLAADLDAVRAQLQPNEQVVVEQAYEGAAIIPPFGDRPVLTSGGERAYIPTGGNNRVAVIDVGADGALTCGPTDDGGAQGAPRCGEAPFALQLTSADPADVVIIDEARDGEGVLGRVDGLVTFLSSGSVVFFSDDRSRDSAEPLRIEGFLELGTLIGGVRSAVLRPAVAGTEPVVLAAMELDARSAGFAGARLALFAPRPDSAIASFDVTAATGALSMRDIVLVPGEDGDNDALVVALRVPDALARFEIDERGALPSLRLTGVASTCRAPTGLAYAAVPTEAGPVDRVLLTCQDGDVVEALDPLTLQTTDVVRFLGRGPYDVVVSTAVEPAEAYVSFFQDGSIGVLQLVDEDGLPRLRSRGRIGQALPRPEDGRE